MRGRRNAYRVKPEGKRKLGRPRHRWEDNIKVDLKNRIGWYGVDSSGLGQGQVAGPVNKLMNFGVH
jgi:hypothetical protein